MTQTLTERAALAAASAGTIAMLAIAGPAFADLNSSTITVSTENTGEISSHTSASASTGYNEAGGSRGGRGGSGGEIEANASDGTAAGNNTNSIGGNGGDGGSSSDGGYVQTGDAMADAGVLNTLNSTDVGIGTDGNINSTTVAVATSNSGGIADMTHARARTGGNDAHGSYAGSGGRGGDVEALGGDTSGNNIGSGGGSGGSGGDAGIGGTVLTGGSASSSGAINVLNTVLVRVNHSQL